LADVAFDNLKVANAAVAKLSDALDLSERLRHELRLDQQDKIAVLARETFQQTVGNETGKPGYEKCFSIRHQSA
jgi:hypothetical protein